MMIILITIVKIITTEINNNDSGVRMPIMLKLMLTTVKKVNIKNNDINQTVII